MLLADSSAWIEFLRATGSPIHHRMRSALEAQEVVVTDPVLAEVLRGARPETADRLLRLLSAQEFEPVATRLDWVDAAALYRAGRARGVTIRGLVDCLVAAVAIRTGLAVLHHDRDFAQLVGWTRLEIVEV